MIINNDNSYFKGDARDELVVRVHYRTDPCRGAMHSPEDMLGWLMQMPYVMAVELDQGKFFKDMPWWVLEKED